MEKAFQHICNLHELDLTVIKATFIRAAFAGGEVYRVECKGKHGIEILDGYLCGYAPNESVIRGKIAYLGSGAFENLSRVMG